VVPSPVDPAAFLLGDAPVMRRVRADLVRLAPFPWHVRIEGPSGSGKSVAAHFLHSVSPRARAPFVLCNLANLTTGTAGGDLLGSRKGAYTSAEDRAGPFEAAHSGTLFLDELAKARPEAQRALLQLVDTGVVHRKGDVRGRRVDVRCVFATNANLEAAVLAGRFLPDLYQRLGLLVVRMPALADHPEDIPLLLTQLLAAKGAEAGQPVPGIEDRDLERLLTYAWPGNVRELAKVAEYFFVFHRLPKLKGRGPRRGSWRRQVPETLAACDGNKARAARQLGVSRQALHGALGDAKA
jgi:two-component system, NtrC family, response regulator HydG